MDTKTQGIVQIVFAVLTIILVFSLNNEIEKFKELGYLGLFIIAIASSATVLIPGPGRFIVLALGRSLDPILVGLIGGTGSAIGELTGYVAGRGASDIINTNSQFKKYKEWVEKYDVLAIFVLALIPNPVFDIAGLAAGALKIPVWRYLLATACGRILSFTILAYLGKLSLQYI
ncbi:MAG: VTT domain-containing protein [Candidatus Micrarchaeota archaeon]|nr:VTT domain-containing protein [Candidatus Micrarchaeota archaeon]